jgi:hypothetical protein
MLPRAILNSAAARGIAMKFTLAVLAVSLYLATVAPVFGHHSFASEFDDNKPITVTGVVTKFEWTNPHTWIYVDGKDETGKATSWSFECAAPSLLIRRGLTKKTLKAGDMIVVEGFRAKDGTAIASSTNVTFPDGRKVRTGVVGGPGEQ